MRDLPSAATPMTITEQLAAALRPFAIATSQFLSHADDRPIAGTIGTWFGDERDRQLTVSDLRAASSALAAYEASKAEPAQGQDNGLRQVREVLREFVKGLARAGFPPTVRIGTNLQSLSNGLQLRHLETLLHHLDDTHGAGYEASKAPARGARYQHLKTGGLYEVLGLARLEWNLDPVVVYRSEHDGSLWVRPEAEFYDGRFIPVPLAEAR